MAKQGKVNTKFAIILGGALLVAFGVVGLAAYSMLSKSAEDNKKEAEALLAKGNVEQAVAAAGRAVNKEPGNVAYLEFWVSCMEKTQPLTAQSYADRFFLQYMVALQKIADVQRTNVPAHERVLKLRYTQLELGNAPASGWTDFVALVDKAMSKFRPEDAQEAKGRAVIGRFRGLARVALLGRRFDMTPDDRKQARADLEAALAADPTLDDALLAWTELLGGEAAQLERQNRKDEAGKLIDMIKAKVAEFRKANPSAVGAALAEARLTLSESVAASGARTTQADLQAKAAPIVESLLTLAEKADPKSLPNDMLFEASKLAVAARTPGAYERLRAVWQRQVDANKSDPIPLIIRGQLGMMAERFEEAIADLEPLVQMKDLPLSLSGLLLFDLRPSGRYMQVTAALMMAEKANDDARTAALTKAKALREQLVTELGKTDTRVQLVDGKLALLGGDYAEARKLLSTYTAARGEDAEAVRLLAQVLTRQNNTGGAMQQWKRLTEMDPTNVEAWLMLAETQSAIQDRAGAITSLRRAEVLLPGVAEITKRRQMMENLQAGVQATDPILKALAQADERVNAVPQDVKGAREILKKVAADVKDDTDVVTGLGLVRALAMLSDRETAQGVMAKLAVKNADDPRFKATQAALARAAETPKTPEEVIKAIDELADAPDFEKAWDKFVINLRRGDMAKAEEEFAKAEKLDPKHPYVIGRKFDLALQKKEYDAAAKFAETAKQINADKAGGATFEARLAAAQGRMPDAIRMIRAAADADPYNFALWRQLGQLSLRASEIPGAIAALQKAVSIKPDDPEAVVLLVRAQVIGGDQLGALELCRKSLLIAKDDPDFINLWLELESQVGKPDLALDRRKQLFASDPRNRFNGAALMRMMLEQRDVKGASDVLAKITEQGWADEVAPLHAMLLSLQGKSTEARALFDAQIAKLKPEDRRPEVYIGFTRAVSQLGAADLAESILRDARPIQSPDGMDIDRELGDHYFQRGMYDKAVSAYRTARDSVKVDEGNALSQRIIEGLLRQNMVAEAESEGANVKPVDDDAKYRLLLLKAEGKMLKKETAAARTVLDEAVSLRPKEWIGYFKRAQTAVTDPTLIADAIADLEEALKLNPGANPVRMTLGSLYVVRGERKRGVQLLRDGLARDPGNEDLRRALINGLVRLGEPKEAVLLAEEAYDRTRQAGWAGQAADLHLAMRNYPQAVKFFAILWERSQDPQIKVDDKRSVAMRYVNALINSQPPDIKTAKTVIATPELDVDNAPAMRLLRAWMLMRDARPKDAEADALAAWRKLDVKNFNLVGEYMNSLRLVYTPSRDQAPRLGDMITFVQGTLAREQTSDSVECQVALMMMADPARRADALREMQRLLTAGTNPDVIRTAARVVGADQYTKKDYAAAVATFQIGLKAAPDDAELLNNVGYGLAKHLGKPQEGLPLIARAVERAPSNANTQDSLGAVLLALGKYDEAEPPLRKAMEVARNDLERAAPIIHLIEVKLAKQDKRAADELFRQLQALIAEEPAPKQIEVAYREDIDRVTRLLQGGN